MSKFKTMPGDLEINRLGTIIQKYNPNHGADGRFTSGGGAGTASLSEGDIHLNNVFGVAFEDKYARTIFQEIQKQKIKKSKCLFSKD